ncbi:uncharacterized protein LOC142564312 [Dermacentor variabilis]|uniref:uncharacterized protein LOC142564312 n=1 Tax=Dermacentor variabilis TaxID=34621 RepID=UPI003F5B2BB7
MEEKTKLMKKSSDPSPKKTAGRMEYMIFIVVVLTGTECFASNAYRQLGDCRLVLGTSSPKSSCYYVCTYDGNRLTRGMYIDGTACWHPKQHGKIGQCMRGVCILAQDEDSYFNPATNSVPCDGYYHGKGYTTSCRYTCKHHGRPKQMYYIAGTPCIILNEEAEAIRNAGVCMRGACIPYHELESKYPNIENKVFPRRFRKCPQKNHYGRNTLSSCYYYCQQKNEWFYGYYTSSYNSACEGVGPRRVSGYCCDGKCIPKANCGQDVEDTAPWFRSQG